MLQETASGKDKQPVCYNSDVFGERPAMTKSLTGRCCSCFALAAAGGRCEGSGPLTTTCLLILLCS